MGNSNITFSTSSQNTFWTNMLLKAVIKVSFFCFWETEPRTNWCFWHLYVSARLRWGKRWLTNVYFLHPHNLLQESPKEETSSGKVSAPRNLLSLLLTKDTGLFLERRITFLVLPTRNWFVEYSVLIWKAEDSSKHGNSIGWGGGMVTHRDLDSHCEKGN